MASPGKENIDIDRLIARNLAGAASTNEEKELKDWILASDENYQQYKVLQESSIASFKEEKLLITDESFNRVWAKAITQEKTIHHHIGFKVMKAIAVSAASFALILISIFTYRQVIYNQQVADNGKEPIIIEKFSPVGQKTKVFLPDGSQVWLNADSKLQYSSAFGDSLRSVWLTGEAYFEIKEDVSQPFIVKSGNVAITALGTRFNMNTYFNHSDIEIVLDEGELLIENLFSSLIPGMPLKTTLKPGNKALYSIRDAIFRIENIDNPFDYTCWKDGILSFHQADFETVINSLERWYGVEFLYDDQPNLGWNITGDFNNEYLESVLKSLGIEEDFSYEIKNNAVQLIFD